MNYDNYDDAYFFNIFLKHSYLLHYVDNNIEV